jgi:N-acetylglucosamine-6-phosphate deacetylase
MSITLYGRAFIGGEIRNDTSIVIEGDQIAAVDGLRTRPTLEVPGVIVPGFIDMHVHGGDGADFMDGSDEAAARVASFHARNGTTAMAATTLSGSREAIRDAVAAITHVAKLCPKTCAEICAIHLEGPYINIHRAGAQNVASIRPADIHEVDALLAQAPNLRWIITLAPELDGARGLIEHFRDRVLFSIGHTAADYAEAVAALEWGASHFTHLFNAMTGVHHREPGTAGAALVSPHATAELIADGIHVHPAVLRIAASAMPRRIALITDAVRAAGMPDGKYKLYEHEFSVSAGAARLGDGTLAGSVLTMQRAVQNMVELAGLPFEMVIPLATEVPARILGVSDRKGRIAKGYDADLVVLSPRFEVERVFVRGHELGNGR